MVNHNGLTDETLKRVFAALTSPARRAILMRLEQGGPVSISELAGPIAMTLPAVMKHLDVLEHARLVTRAKHGRTVYLRLSPGPMAQASAWLQRYERFWPARLDRLVAYAEAREKPTDETEEKAEMTAPTKPKAGR